MKNIKEMLKFGVHYTEASSKAYFFHLCMVNDIEIYVEHVLIGNIGRPDSIAVFRNKIIIVEFKYRSFVYKENTKFNNINTPQFKKYSRLNIPIVVIDKYEYVEKVFNILLVTTLKKGIFVYNSEINKLEHNPYPKRKKP